MNAKELTAKRAKEVLLDPEFIGLERGDTLYCVVRHVSASGMSRRISLFMAKGKNNIRCIDYRASEALGWKEHKDGGIIVRGTGMDMGFHLVYELSSVLFGDGYALKKSWL